MREESGGTPFAWNVAGLLADESGAVRTYEIDGARVDLAEDVTLAVPISGAVHVRRTNRGVMVAASLSGALDAPCSRCLRPLVIPVDVRVDEEYLPTLDLGSGRPVSLDAEPEALRLDDHHELDLAPAVREAFLLAEPIAPVCRADCPGLCVVCGLELEGGPHDHGDQEIDPRFAVLRGFEVDGEPRTR